MHRFLFVLLFIVAAGAMPSDASAQRPIHPRWSADGFKLIYYVLDEGTTDVFITDLLSGTSQNITGDAVFDSNPDISPDGKKAVYGRAIDGNWDVWTQDLHTGELNRITETPEREMHFSWSPDGKWISYIRWVSESNTDVFVYNVESGQERQITFTPTTKEFHPKWAADSQSLVYDSDAVEHGTVYRSGIQEGAKPERLLPDGKSGRTPSLSPDGSTLAVARPRGDGALQEIALRNLASGHERILVSTFSGGGPVFSPDGTRIAYHVFGSDATDSFLVVHSLDTGWETLIHVDADPSVLEKPLAFEFGASMASIRDQILLACDEISSRKVEPAELPTATEHQYQMDCTGFDFAGKERLVELIFANDQLDMIWILTEESESDSLVEMFTSQLGEPSHVKEDLVFWLDAGTAVRKAPHEVLFISDRLKEPYRSFLEMH